VTHSHRDITELLTQHGLAPRRAFGQNFVSDPNTVRRIARMANVGPNDHVVEIGAGLGSLTLALAETGARITATGARITAIEIDHGIAPVLRDVVKDLPNVSVVVGDALELDWNEIIPPGSKAVVVANLPYNVATPLVADLLDAIPQISRFVVMVQKEVALRLASSVGSSDYGAISVKVAYWATARVLGDVPPSVFIPRPKVTSSIIEITRRETPAVGPHIAPQQLFKVIRTGFGQRRKMLRRSLAAIATPENFALAGVSPEARPEELDVHQWGRLATEIQKNQRS